VINATVELGVEDSVLIKYLVDELGISAAKKHAQSPVFMMFSVLSLALSSYKDLKANPQGMSHDEQYKHLFYTTANPCFKRTSKSLCSTTCLKACVS
jgi:hypothetical protein